MHSLRLHFLSRMQAAHSPPQGGACPHVPPSPYAYAQHPSSVKVRSPK